MSAKDYPANFVELLQSITAKRPKTVIDHILQHGQITTEELKNLYGYNHPPRAIRDVKEHGIPIKMFRVTGSDGRKIAAYRFGDPADIRATQLSGRTAYSANLKAMLIEKYGIRCNIYLESFPVRELQIDHRVPFEISGDNSELSSDVNEYMLLCASANRAKSCSCENCLNWKNKDVAICKTCYWAYPESYNHVAMHNIRRLDLLWSSEEVADYDTLLKAANKIKETLPEYVKNVLRSHFNKNGG